MVHYTLLPNKAADSPLEKPYPDRKPEKLPLPHQNLARLGVEIASFTSLAIFPKPKTLKPRTQRKKV